MMKRVITVLLGVLLGGCAGLAANIQVFSMFLPPLPTLATLPPAPSPSSTPTHLPELETTIPALISNTPATLEAELSSPVTTSSQPSPTSPTPSLSPSPTPYLYVQGPVFFPEEINPLTGLPADEPDLLNRRPIAVKVTNFPRSVRPQWGLSLADHVYEYYIGDDMSRFIGIFYGQDASQVGPVRSARLFDEHIMRLYQANFAFGWADDPILETLLIPELLPRLIVEHADNCPPLCRIGPKYAYNNLYIDTSTVKSYQESRRAENERQTLDGLRFELATPKSGNPGESVFLSYSSVSYHRWEYDPAAGHYLRYQETKSRLEDQASYAPLTDALTGAQLSADNILVLLLPHEYFYQSSSTEIIDQPITGEGVAFAFRDGQIYPLHWSRPDTQAMLKFTLPNQRPYPLKPGNVWFEIIGESSAISLQPDGSWDFEFSMP
ncbi:MAG TPA: DUF3048 domain-containing protein [Anaerolineales bacterium]|nr:DUF3048 domain-containing protein [Anaerolineales bacterium]